MTTFENNGIPMRDAPEITCRECGKPLKTIEEFHLQGNHCTNRKADRAEYWTVYPTDPVITAQAYEEMTRQTAVR